MTVCISFSCYLHPRNKERRQPKTVLEYRDCSYILGRIVPNFHTELLFFFFSFVCMSTCLFVSMTGCKTGEQSSDPNAWVHKGWLLAHTQSCQWLTESIQKYLALNKKMSFMFVHKAVKVAFAMHALKVHQTVFDEPKAVHFHLKQQSLGITHQFQETGLITSIAYEDSKLHHLISISKERSYDTESKFLELIVEICLLQI